MLRKPIVLTMISAIALTGCVTTREERIGANDGSDACYQYRVALDSTGDFYAEDMMKGALIGAAAGAATGLLVRGNPQAALIGAVAGGVAGAAGGYWYSKMQQGRDQAVLAVLSDMQKETESLNKTQLALDQLVNCRRAEVQRVKADFKAKRITREVADQRLAAIRQQLHKDYEIASKISADVVKRRDEFLNAADNITPGSSERIRLASQTAKPSSKPKPKPNAQKAAPDNAAQAVAHVTTAYQTSERVVQAPARIQTVMKEASLEPA